MFYERWDFTINKAFGYSVPVRCLIQDHQRDESKFCSFSVLTSPYNTHICKGLGQGHHLYLAQSRYLC